MQELLLSQPDLLEPYPSPADLPEILDPTVWDPAVNAIIWEDAGGNLAGFAIVSAYHNLHFHFRSGWLTRAREIEMMTWAIQRVQQITHAAGLPASLDASARDDDLEKVAFLTRNGFTASENLTLYMERSLLTPFPVPIFPPGFTLRPLMGETEVEAYVSAHRAAYGTQHMTVAERLSIMRQPHYQPDLDLVAITPDGTLAAFCICSIEHSKNQQNGLGKGDISIVGVQPAYRGQGLGLAMVLAGMRALRQHGSTLASLSVGSWNTAAIHIYQSAGFQTRWQRRWYSKGVNP